MCAVNAWGGTAFKRMGLLHLNWRITDGSHASLEGFTNAVAVSKTANSSLFHSSGGGPRLLDHYNQLVILRYFMIFFRFFQDFLRDFKMKGMKPKE